MVGSLVRRDKGRGIQGEGVRGTLKKRAKLGSIPHQYISNCFF